MGSKHSEIRATVASGGTIIASVSPGEAASLLQVCRPPVAAARGLGGDCIIDLMRLIGRLTRVFRGLDYYKCARSSDVYALDSHRTFLDAPHFPITARLTFLDLAAARYLLGRYSPELKAAAAAVRPSRRRRGDPPHRQRRNGLLNHGDEPATILLDDRFVDLLPDAEIFRTGDDGAV